MSERLVEVAQRIQEQPWNWPGSGKTWVLNAMSMEPQFQEEIRQAERVRNRSRICPRVVRAEPGERRVRRRGLWLERARSLAS
ncbi:MAG: hypothetical protein JRF61_17410 [Deltaproteobacteria bacterium]|nr:hypothetical protein [Deltaproteobacteria bacterium]